MKNCVYRFLNKDNEIIYIGKAVNLISRMYGHNHLPKLCYKETTKLEFCSFNTEDDMDLAERYYIPKYKPKYNTVLSNRSITLSLSELDNMKWIDIKEYEKIQYEKRIKEWEEYKSKRDEENRLKREKVRRDRKLNKKLNETILNIKIYIKRKELEKDIKLNINVDDYNINLDNFRDFYDYIDNKINTVISERLHDDSNNREVICKGTGERFKNLIEYREYMNTDISLESLIKVAKGEHILLGIYHPKYYGVFSRPIFLETFEGYDYDTQQRIKNSIAQDIREIICLTTEERFSTKYLASDTSNVSHNLILKCCNNKSNYAGSFDNKPLVWKWYDEYVNMTQEEIDRYISKAYEIYRKRSKVT